MPCSSVRSRSRVSPIVRLPLLSPRLRRRWSDLPSPTLDAQTANANGDVASASTTAGVSALACVADGVFVSGDDAGTLTMWSASTEHDAIALDRGAAVARAHDACISSICVVADKSRFVTAGAEGAAVGRPAHLLGLGRVAAVRGALPVTLAGGRHNSNTCACCCQLVLRDARLRSSLMRLINCFG